MSRELLLADYFFLFEPIVQRLREQLAPLAAQFGDLPIEGIDELTAAGAGDHRPLVLYVLWAGDSFDAETSSGRSNLMRQRWELLLRVAHEGQGPSRNNQAGKLLGALHKAMAGWEPEGLARGFKRVAGPRPDYSKKSALYPLDFEIQLNL